ADALLDVPRGRRRYRPGLDDDGGLWFGVGRREEATAEERAPADGDPDGGVAVRAGQGFLAEEVRDAGGDVGFGGGGQRDGQAVGGRAQPRKVFLELRHVTRPGAQRLEHRVAQLET